MSYKIHNLTFNSKKQISEKIQEIERNHSDFQPIIGEDFNFLMDILKHHSFFKRKMKGMTDIYFAPSLKYPSNRCVHIAYGDKNSNIQSRSSDDISWTFCLNKLGKKETNIFKFTFGKYRGKTLKQVDNIDRSYLHWAANEISDETIKTKIQEYLKMDNNTQQKINYNINTTTDKNSKISVYDTNGYLIRTYSKAVDASYDGFDPKKISKCLTGVMKTHNNCIFKRIENNMPELKIDPFQFIVPKNSLRFKQQILMNNNSNTNNSIIDNISIHSSTPDDQTNKIKIPINNNLRVGMFSKNGTLLKIFLNTKEVLDDEIISKYTIYRYIYGNLTPNRLKKGYKGKYHFRRLIPGNTYTIGEKYDYKSIPYDTQSKFIKNKKPQQNKTSKLKSIPSNKEQKKGILTRIINFFNL